MSIHTTIDSLKRASAVCHAVAKRGNLVLVERRHSYSSLLHGAYAGYVGYTPGIASSVTRDGVVKEVRLAGQSWPLKRRDWQYVHVDTSGRLDPQRVVAALVDANGHATEFKDQGEAIAAIKAAAGIGR